MPNMVELIKKAASEAMEASKPTGIFYGEVVSVSPLRIRIDQKLTLEAAHLMLTSLVSNFNVSMYVNHTTGDTDGHTHDYKGTKQFAVKLGLSVGENVIMMRMQGGQKYIVLDRLR